MAHILLLVGQGVAACGESPAIQRLHQRHLDCHLHENSIHDQYMYYFRVPGDHDGLLRDGISGLHHVAIATDVCGPVVSPEGKNMLTSVASAMWRRR